MFSSILIYTAIIAAPILQPVVEGRPQIIQTTGMGRPSLRHPPAQACLMARRAAEVAAVRNAARADGQGNVMFVRGFQYLHSRTHADGSVEVTVQYQRQTTSAPVIRDVR
jgi:hypothetical protein